MYTEEEWEDLILSGMKLLLADHSCYESQVFIGGISLNKFTKEEVISIFSSWVSDKVPVFSFSQQSNNQSNDST